MAILGAERDGALGGWLAASGARVMASVGATTTMLVIATGSPSGVSRPPMRRVGARRN